VDTRTSLVDRRASLVDRRASLVDMLTSLVDMLTSLVDRRASFVDRRASFVDRRASFADRRASFVDRLASLASSPPFRRDFEPLQKFGRALEKKTALGLQNAPLAGLTYLRASRRACCSASAFMTGRRKTRRLPRSR
jgi:hypothetical protein